MTQFNPKNSDIKNLILYHTPYCPYCSLVRNEIDSLGLNIESRDTASNPKDREDLIANRNRATVPVLRIQYKDGTETWMPESRDIVTFLRSEFSSHTPS